MRSWFNVENNMTHSGDLAHVEVHYLEFLKPRECLISSMPSHEHQGKIK